ncbi:ABC transporter permease [Rhodococcoides yunnanense]|uniref:ABC transporter permease n=1 Tax=Rhodococcoides yunnanense TaxID=278209 RepID=UPI0009352F87|nr:ABC transporter permease [Rhodococcus yunnanensis]
MTDTASVKQTQPQTSNTTGTEASGTSGRREGKPTRRAWGPGNIGTVYVLIAMCIYFTFTASGAFDRVDTIKLVLNGAAIVALSALALTIPLATGLFDLSFAYAMTLSGVTTAYFIVEHGWNVWSAVGAGLIAALGIGVVNCIVVVGMRIDSFIGTLATGSLIIAFTAYVTGGTNITGPALAGAFSSIYGTRLFGLILPVYYAVGLAVVLWLLLEHTATGRRLYAVGFNAGAAGLAGIKVTRLRVSALLTSSLLAGFAGIVLASSLSSGSVTGGTPYLLSAYATAFLGATQLKKGRFNAWGTILAVIMLQTGITGLALSGAPPWGADMFTGIMLIAALSATSAQSRARRGGRERVLGRFDLTRLVLRRRSAESTEESHAAATDGTH